MAKSPRYPAVSLGDAISRVKAIYEREHMSSLSPPVAAEAMGYKGINGTSLRMIGALRQYGLIEGRGEDVKVSKDAQTLLIDDPSSPDYVAAVRRVSLNPPVFSDLRKQFPSAASERNIAVFLEKKGFKPDAATEVAKNFKDTMGLVPEEGSSYTEKEEGEFTPFGRGDGMQTQVGEPRRATMRLGAMDPPASNVPVRVVMNGNRLDIQASVDLAGLKKLQEMLTKYQGILEMQEPGDDVVG